MSSKVIVQRPPTNLAPNMNLGERLSFSSLSDRQPEPIATQESPRVIAMTQDRTGEQQQQRRSVWFWFGLAVFCCVWISATRVWSQPPAFEQFPLAENLTTPEIEKQIEGLAKSLITSRDISAMTERDRAKARFFLNKFLVWKLTQPKNLPIVASTINDLVDSISRGQRSGAPGTMAYMQYAFEGLKTMAEGNFMPPTRINAVLALSRIELKPFDSQTGRPPVPLPNSFAVLVGLAENQKNPEGVRAAALQGLTYYAKVGVLTMPPDQKQKLATVMKSLLESSPPKGRSPEAHAYLQRFAVDSLNVLAGGEDKTLGTQLVSIASSEKQPDLIALYSASQLGSYRQSLKDTVTDPEPLLKSWSSRAFHAVESEIARINALERPAPAMSQPPAPDSFLSRKQDKKANQAPRAADPNMMMEGSSSMEMSDRSMEMSSDAAYDMMSMDMGMMGGYPGMGVPQAKPQPPEVSLSRRQLTWVLQQIFRGATGSDKGEISQTPGGVLAAVPPAKSEVVTTWVQTLTPVATAINDTALDDQKKWLEMLQTQRVVLANLAGIEIEDAAKEVEAEEPDFNGIPGIFGEPAAVAPAAAAMPAASEEPAAGLPAGMLP